MRVLFSSQIINRFGTKIEAESTNGLSRSKSVKSVRRKSFNYVRKTSKAENQVLL